MTQTELELTAAHTGKWKRYPAYKDSGIEWLREIPAHWELWKISHAFKVVGSGTTPLTSHEEYYEGDISWVNTAELRDNLITNTSKKLTSKALVDYPTLRVYHRGTLLVALYGATIGRIGILDISATTNQACCALSTSECLDVSFTFYWFLAHRQQLILLASGGGQPNISQDTIRSLKIAAPSILEQRSIAAFLDSETDKINTLIAKKERLIELLQEKRSATISHAVTKGLDASVPMKDSGVEWLGEIPAHWEVKRLKFVTSFVTSGSRGWAQYYSDDGPMFLRIGNLSRTSIDSDLRDIQHVLPPKGTEGERTQVKQQDVLISITAYIGSIAVMSENIGEAYVNQHIALTRPYTNIIAPRWLAYCLLSCVGQDQFQLLLNGGTKDGLGLDDVKNLLILMPPLSEQQAIVSYIDHETAKIDALITRIREGDEKLKEYNAALISAAVTGKIDVREEMTEQ